MACCRLAVTHDSLLRSCLVSSREPSTHRLLSCPALVMLPSLLCVCVVRSKDDFNGFLWNVVMLAMGGLALGQAVQSSGLLLSISSVRE